MLSSEQNIGQPIQQNGPEDQHENIQDPEDEKKPGKLVWIIDDNSAGVAAVLRLAKMVTSMRSNGAEYKHFQTGEDAVADFSVLAADEEGTLPTIILMDYKLDDYVESPKFRTGVEVIAELRQIAEDNKRRLPEIIAFSSESSYTDELLSSGANSSIKKTDFPGVKKFFESL